MTDYLLQATLSNVGMSAALAALAFAIQRRGGHPRLAHALWLLVLLKLLTPPGLMLPLLPQADPAPTVAALTESEVLPDLSSAPPPTTTPRTSSDAPLELLPMLLGLWAAGSLLVALTSLLRLGRFRRLLRAASHPADARLHDLAARLAADLGLRRLPELRVTSAAVSPFVWWTGGQVQIVLPAHVVTALPTGELRLVLAHELAHVRRRDHLVRWVEWLACVLFWWNPIVWWARHHLRLTEELGCDALVLAAFHADRHRYANSLLAVAELLTTATLRPPTMASAMHPGGQFEQRLTMILSNRFPRTPRWLKAAALALAAAVLPFGLAQAQDYQAVERRLGGAVEAGEITLEQARVMMDALRRASAQTTERGPSERPAMEARKSRYADAERKIKAAVDAGKISEENAGRRLEALRRELFGDGDAPQRDR